MEKFNQQSTIDSLQSKINSVSEVEDAVLLGITVKDNYQLNSSSVVSTALPDILVNDIPDGVIYYLSDLNVYVVSNDRKWFGLDGRLFRTDGYVDTLWSWGQNGFGQLGNGGGTSRSSPVSVVGGFTDWCQVSFHNTHASAVRQNGTLWAWGDGYFGQLGDNSNIGASSPVSVVGGFTDWCQVSAGNRHTLAVRQNGTLWAWGYNCIGQLGDNTTISKRSPVSVVGGFTDWCQVSAGCYHTSAVRQNGTLWSWGLGSYGRLGNGDAINISSPVSVVGGFTDWCQVSAGGSHTAAVRQNGTLWSWGCNSDGQLGDNSTITNSSPVSVVGGFTDWCQVNAGYSYSAAVRTNGTLWSWGSGSSGILGDGTTVAKSSPVSVIGGFTDWCQAGGGKGVRQNGTVWVWGSGFGGLLGDGTTVAKSSPVLIAGGFTDWCQVCRQIGLRRS